MLLLCTYKVLCSVCLYRSASSDGWLLHWQTLVWPGLFLECASACMMYIHNIDAVRLSAHFECACPMPSPAYTSHVLYAAKQLTGS